METLVCSYLQCLCHSPLRVAVPHAASAAPTAALQAVTASNDNTWPVQRCMCCCRCCLLLSAGVGKVDVQSHGLRSGRSGKRRVEWCVGSATTHQLSLSCSACGTVLSTCTCNLPQTPSCCPSPCPQHKALPAAVVRVTYSPHCRALLRSATLNGCILQ